MEGAKAKIYGVSRDRTSDLPIVWDTFLIYLQSNALPTTPSPHLLKNMTIFSFTRGIVIHWLSSGRPWSVSHLYSPAFSVPHPPTTAREQEQDPTSSLHLRIYGKYRLRRIESSIGFNGMPPSILPGPGTGNGQATRSTSSMPKTAKVRRGRRFSEEKERIGKAVRWIIYIIWIWSLSKNVAFFGSHKEQWRENNGSTPGLSKEMNQPIG